MKGELLLHKATMPEGIKPNFSALARQTGLDRHTIARAWKKLENGTQENPKPRYRKSKFDPYDEEIQLKLEIPQMRIKSVFKFLQHKYGKEIFNSYDSFKAHVKARKLFDPSRADTKAHPRYETEYGEQVQLDWVEDLKMELKTGEIIVFNLFTAVFSTSRLTVHIYSRTRTMEDFLRCIIELINMAGGLPHEFITDNMSAVVSSIKDNQKKHPPILQFEKDLDTKIRTLPPRKPERKGKNESSNRYQNWYLPYQNELETEEELIKLTSVITQQINEEESRTTGYPRELLFKKEKEYLRPLRHPIMLDTYLKDVNTQKVPSTLLVQYKGNGYSVPKKFINKRVKLCPIDDELYIYHNAELIAQHPITNKRFNYTESDYKEALRDHYGEKSKNPHRTIDQTIEEQAKHNLDLLARWENKKK